MGKKLFFFLLIFTASLFFGLKNVKAADSDVVINEVMSHPPSPQTKLEWVELYNNGSDAVNLNGWIFEEKNINDSLAIIQPKSYLILTRDVLSFKNQWLFVDPAIPIIPFSMVLADGADSISLKNGSYVDKYSWFKDDTGLNYSWEKINSIITSNDEKSTDGNWQKSFVLGGTPGAENSKLLPPTKPKLVFPENNKEFNNLSPVDFSWQGDLNSDYEFILSSNSNLFSPLVDEKDLGLTKITVEDLDFGKYYWKVISSNSIDAVSSDTYNFEIIKPVYSNEIMINELLPNPTGDDAAGEWIEFFNNSEFNVNLNGWKLADASGKEYQIPKSTIINSFGYVFISRIESGITLNNDGDGIRLYQPDGTLLSETSYINDGDEGWPWARALDNTWAWTTTPTANSLNIFTQTAVDDNSGDTEPIINTVPIEIQTGDYQNYLDKLVKIKGKVISTSGNTFYIDDGSGVVKVYIQEKTGIQKPEMHKNDVFEIVGVVDIYGQTWRILPQNQNDITLIEEALKVSATVKKAASKVVATVKTPLVSKAVAAAATSPPNVSENKSDGLSQFVKMIIGLAIILLALLIVKINQSRKEKVIGGHFGEDET